MSAQINTLDNLESALAVALPQTANLPPDSPDLQSALKVLEQFGMQLTSSLGGEQLFKSGQLADLLAARYLTRVYPDSLNYVVVRQTNDINTAAGDPTFRRSIDILRNSERSVASPLQAKTAEDDIRFINGISAKVIEASFFDDSDAGDEAISSIGVLNETLQQSGSSLIPITADDLSDLAALNLPAEATARIHASALAGNLILTPQKPVSINGEDRIAWIEINGTTLDTTVVLDNGLHGLEEPKDLPLVPQLRALFNRSGFNNTKDVNAALDRLRRATNKQEKQAALEALKVVLSACSSLLEQNLAMITQTRFLFQAENLVNRTLGGLANKTGFVRVNLVTEPPIGDQLYSRETTSAEFADLGTHGETGLAIDLVPDPLFSVPVGGALLNTVYKLGIKNLTGAVGTFTVNLTNLPAGVEAISSVPQLLIPAGAIGEVSIFLRPTSTLPAPGTALPFDVVVTSDANPTVTATVHESASMPSLPAATFELSDLSPNVIPGQSTQSQLTIKSVGNVPADIRFDVSAPAGIAVNGLTPVTIDAANTVTQSLTFTAAPGLSLNTDFTVNITPLVGDTRLDPITVFVHVVAPGVVSADKAATIAGQLGDVDLGRRLKDLSQSLTNLVQNLASDVYKGQALASLDSIISQMEVDPLFVGFVNPLQVARDQLIAATDDAQTLAAITDLGHALDDFAAIVQTLARSNVDVTLTPNTQVAQPLTPREFHVLLHNVGTDTSTYNLSVSGLPAAVTSQFSTSSVTLDRDQFADVVLTLTQTTTDELLAFNFVVDATIAGSTPVIKKSVTGSLRTRNEIISVTSVNLDHPFVDPGVSVDVSARILNAVNQQRDALGSFVVKNSAGTTAFTSPNTAIHLGVVQSLSTFDLGTFATSSLPLGEYSVNVSLTDLLGQPIPGATNEGRLLVGSPVTASLNVSPDVLPPGASTVVNTLQLASNSSNTGAGTTLSLVGQASLSDNFRSSIAQRGNLLYMAAEGGVHIIDVTDPNAPMQVGFLAGRATSLAVDGDRLIIFNEGNSTASPAFARGTISIYSLTTGTIFPPTTPTNPSGQGSLVFGYQFVGGPLVVGDTVYASELLFNFSGNNITSQQGDLLSFDISNPFSPQLSDVLLNTYGTAQDAEGIRSGSPFSFFGAAQANATTLLAASTTESIVNDVLQPGSGVIRIVDISNPTNLQQTGQFVIPNTTFATSVTIVGNRAYVAGSQGGWRDPFTTLDDPGPTGNIVLTELDVSDPRNPSLLGQTILNRAARGAGGLASLGGNRFAFTSLGTLSDTPELYVADFTDPNAVQIVQQIDLTDLPKTYSTDGQFLYLADAAGLKVFSLNGTAPIPVHTEVQVPNNTGVQVVLGSFNIAPTSIEHGTDFDTLKWDLTLNGASPTSITWQSTISNLQPGETRAVTLDSTVDFTSQGADGALTLPPQNVLAKQILSLAPAANTARPGETAAYTLTIVNPTQSPVTYNLSTTGVPADWVGLQSQVTVAAGGSVDVPITITADPFAPLSELGFVVSATTGGVSGSVEGELDLVGTPLLPAADPVARGVVAALLPTSATAGRGTSASYTVQVTNTGSATDTFALSTAGLPAGITASFEQSSVEVPPGAGNFLDITLTLTAAGNLAPSAYPFQVQAVSAADSSISDTAAGALNVVSQGVQATLSPSAGPPGTTFQLTVTNAGTASDTFNLSLSGPAALVSTLAATQITLAAGASRVVNITTTAINFADPGSLPLFATATSQANSAVKSTAGTSLTISPTQGLTAAFTPASQTLMQPGAADFSLNVNNIGNTEDSFVASIIGVSGPISAMLMGLDGQPTNSIPLFRLPGLASGQLQLLTNSSTVGTGNVTVKIASLTDPNQSVTVQAQLRIGNPNNVGNAGILLLDTSGKGALTNSGNGGIRVNGGGHIVIDSNNSKAGIDTGKGVISAAEIDVVGKLYTAGKGKFQGTIVQNAARVADPLAALAPPTAASPTFKCANISGKKTVTLSPGTYVGGIKITGSASVTLLPGIYYLQGGGLSISGTAKLTGDGVMIYNVPKKSCDGINIAPNTTVTLSAPTSGTYQSIVLFEQRSTKAPINISGGNVSLTGIVYAPSAKLAFAGNKSVNINSNAALGISAALILADLVSSGNGAIVVNVDPSQVSPTLQTSMSASASLRTASVLAVPQTKASDANEQQFHKSTATSVSNGATPRPVPSPLLQAALTQFSLSDWDEVTAHATPKAVDEIFSALAGFETQKIFPSI